MLDIASRYEDSFGTAGVPQPHLELLGTSKGGRLSD